MLHYDEGLPKQLQAGAEVGAVGARTASGAPPPVQALLSAGTGCPTRAPAKADALPQPPPAGLCGCRPGHPPRSCATSKHHRGRAVMAPSPHLGGACIWVVTKVTAETSRVLVPIPSTPASLGMKGATKHEGEEQTSVPGKVNAALGCLSLAQVCRHLGHLQQHPPTLFTCISRALTQRCSPCFSQGQPAPEKGSRGGSFAAKLSPPLQEQPGGEPCA